MKPRLSVVLPIFNAQATIGSLMSEMLEVLAEATPHFELWLVDDGSTDSTGEVIRELVSNYPQADTLHHPLRRGVASAMHTALEHVRGEQVLFCDEGCPADVFEISKLWRAAATHDLVIGKLATHSPLALAQNTTTSGESRPEGLGAAMIITRRHFATQWSMRSAGESLVAYAIRKGLSFERLTVRARVTRSAKSSVSAVLANRSTRIDRGQPAMVAAIDHKRPNILSRFRSFALGE